MSRPTPALRLPYFERGDRYSAMVDRARMLMVDDQLHAFANAVGDGVVDGFESSVADSSCTIGPGSAFIDGIYCRMALATTTTLPSAGEGVYIKRQPNALTKYGKFSSSRKAVVSDSLAVVAPILSANILDGKVELFLDWESASIATKHAHLLVDGVFVTSIDRQHSGWSLPINEGDTVSLSLVPYSYIGESGTPSNPLVVSRVFLDETPSAPTGFAVVENYESASLIFDRAPTGLVQSKVISWIELDGFGNEVGEESEVSVSAESTHFVITGLKNRSKYRVSIVHESIYGKLSFAAVKYFTPSSAAVAGDVDDVVVEALRSLTGAFYLSIRPVSDDTYATLSSIYVRVHKNGSFGFEYSSQDMRMPASGVLTASSLKVAEGNGFSTRPIEDNASYTVVLYRRIGSQQTRGRFAKVYTGDSTPPQSPDSLSASASEQGEIRLVWSHAQPVDVSYFDVSVVTSQVLSRSPVLTEPLWDAVYIARRSINNRCDFSFTVRGRTFRIDGVENEDFAMVDGFTSASLDLSGKTIVDMVKFINSASVRLKSKSTGIVYAIYQLIEAKSPFTYAPNLAESADGVRLLLPGNSAELMMEFAGSRISDDSPIGVRNAVVNTDYDDQTGGFFSAGGVILQSRSPSDGDSSNRYIYTYGANENTVSSRTRLASYSLPAVLVKPGYRYSFSVYAVDGSGNSSDASTYEFVSPFVEDMTSPSMMDQVAISPVQEGMLVTWNGASRLPAKRFIIFRSSVSASGVVGQYSQIASIDNSSYQYEDIMVSDGASYMYRVGYENFWGRSSPAPSSAETEAKIGVVSQYISRSDLAGPTGLSASMVSDDLVCTWNLYPYACDGLEIWISDPVIGRFSRAGSASREQTSFTLRNARTAKGEYRFAIRAIVSECAIMVSDIGNPPDNSMLLYEGSGASLLHDRRRIISSLHDPIVDAAAEIIEQHRHFRYADGADMRIDLGDHYVISQYSTSDNRTYLPVAPIEAGINASEGIVFVNGGPPSVSYYMTEDGNIVFADLLDSNASVKAVIFGTSEVDGELEQNRVGVLSAQQLSSGRLRRSILPELEHDAQFAKMSPVSCLAETVDGYKWFATVNERRKVRYQHSDPTTYWSEVPVEIADAQAEAPLGSRPSSFPLCRGGGRSMVHDILSDGAYAFLATSVGSYYLSDISLINDSTVQELRQSQPPDDCGSIHRVRRLSFDVVAFVGFRGIDILSLRPDSNGRLSPIASSLGISDGVKCFRDIFKADDGSFIGVASNALWKISIRPNGVVTRSQMRPVADGGATIWCAFLMGSNMYVYTDAGMVVGDQAGTFFEPVDFVPPRLKVVDFVRISETQVALVATHSIWLIGPSSARRVVDSKVRLGRGCIHDGKLFICSDSGLMSTDAGTNIYGSPSYRLVRVNVPRFEDGRFFLPLTVHSDGQRIYVGGEGGVLSTLNVNRWGKLLDTHVSPLGGGIPVPQALSQESPTVYVDGSPRHLGVYFQFSKDAAVFEPLASDNAETSQVETGQAECIFFDDPPDTEQDVRVARTYHAWVHPKGTWAHIDYAAPIALKVNGYQVNDGSRARRPYDDVAYIASLRPQFGEEASAASSFSNAFDEMVSHADFMLVNTSDPVTGEATSYGAHKFSRANMRALLRRIERANRFVYDTAALARMGVDADYRIPNPLIRVDLIANAFLAPYGVRKGQLDLIGISYGSFEGEEVRGDIGVWDAEDIGYRLPPVAPRDISTGSLAPNYEPLPADEDMLTVPIEDLSFTGEFTYFGAIPGVMRFFGRRRPDGAILRGPSDVLSEKLDQV